MEYKINPSVYASMLPLPMSLIDENLRLAGACQLKTILFFFRCAANGRFPSESEISEAIGYSREDVADALIFWQERGFLLSNEQEVAFRVEKPSEESSDGKKDASKQTVEKQSIPIVKPSFEQLAQRLEESEDLKVLFREAQEILGKTIGFSGQSTLLMIHDSYGLPVFVILTLLQYAKSVGRSGWSQISNLAKDWSEREIFSIEDAEEYIREQNAVDDLWKRFRLLTGVTNNLPTSKQRKYFAKWSGEYDFGAEMIVLAYERAVEQTGKFSLAYADKVLKSWSTAGLKTPEDVEKSEEEFASAKKQKTGGKSGQSGKGKKSSESIFSSDASYDLSKYADLGLNIGKRGKNGV